MLPMAAKVVSIWHNLSKIRMWIGNRVGSLSYPKQPLHNAWRGWFSRDSPEK